MHDICSPGGVTLLRRNSCRRLQYEPPYSDSPIFITRLYYCIYLRVLAETLLVCLNSNRPCKCVACKIVFFFNSLLVKHAFNVNGKVQLLCCHLFTLKTRFITCLWQKKKKKTHLDYYFLFLQPVYSFILYLAFGIGGFDSEWHVRCGRDYWISCKAWQ